MGDSGIFRIDMLRAKVMVRFDEDLDNAKHHTERFLGCRVADTARGLGGYAVAHYRKVVVWLAPNASLGTVIHECYHATHRLLEEIGSEAKDEELNAHLHEFITERVLTFWEKNKQKGKI